MVRCEGAKGPGGGRGGGGVCSGDVTRGKKETMCSPPFHFPLTRLLLLSPHLSLPEGLKAAPTSPCLALLATPATPQTTAWE